MSLQGLKWWSDRTYRTLHTRFNNCCIQLVGLFIHQRKIRPDESWDWARYSWYALVFWPSNGNRHHAIFLVIQFLNGVALYFSGVASLQGRAESSQANPPRMLS